MKTEILSTHNPQLFSDAIKRAAALLRAGEVVALPTETVYGLAANALDERAVAKIFQIKGRPAHNPLIVHVASHEMARRCAKNFPALAEKFAKAFWPGPLTLVLPGAEHLPGNVTAGGQTVGIRWPGHPFIQAVVRECDFPLAAPSANLSNRVSPTNAEHVRAQLAGKIPLIVDGGQSQVGIESTVLDLSVSPPNSAAGHDPRGITRRPSGGNPKSRQGFQCPKRRNSAQPRHVAKTLFSQGKIAGFKLGIMKPMCVPSFQPSTSNFQPSTSSPIPGFPPVKISRA